VTATPELIDPYLDSLSTNYYYPLHDYTMDTSVDDSLTQTSRTFNNQHPSTHATQGKVTVESSINAITELIEEMTGDDGLVQSTQGEVQQNVALQQVLQAKPSGYCHRFSIYRRSGTPISKSQLTLFKLFAHSIKAADNQAQILPIQNDKCMLPPINYRSN
jgi:hypothetical protein